ncbi:MAG: hypothetical protein HYY20_06225 [Candidatus Tectomicrobia bacterium]|uniref:Uncharacterized protein n=1 Tax=Tectimicrobiota bacterium TaxID=2528274 RepID=A0A932G0M0_UNCTE|nr:hypothetical protein [Candidatus Tectomicrobia bacterium]
MAKPFKILREKMSPEARERSEQKAGELEIVAHFPDGTVRITQFESLDRVESPDLGTP